MANDFSMGATEGILTPPHPERSYWKNLWKRVWKRVQKKWPESYSEWADRPLERYGYSYFDHLCSEFEILDSRTQPGNTAANELALERASRIYKKKDRGPITMGDLYAFEMAILQLQPKERLCRRAFSLRAKYHDIASQRAYEDYLASSPPSPPERPDDTNIIPLREDLENILGEFHWMYTITPAREELRKTISASLSGWAAITILAIAALAFLYYILVADSLPVLAAVLIMGVLGAYVSVQRRLQRSSTEGDPIVGILELEKSRLSLIFMALASGAIFAALLYLMFIADLMQGTLFPVIQVSSPRRQTGATTMFAQFAAFFASFGPATVADLAKLLVWSFIAGFAERLVPDALDRLGTAKLTSTEVKAGT